MQVQTFLGTHLGVDLPFPTFGAYQNSNSAKQFSEAEVKVSILPACNMMELFRKCSQTGAWVEFVYCFSTSNISVPALRVNDGESCIFIARHQELRLQSPDWILSPTDR